MTATINQRRQPIAIADLISVPAAWLRIAIRGDATHVRSLVATLMLSACTVTMALSRLRRRILAPRPALVTLFFYSQQNVPFKVVAAKTDSCIKETGFVVCSPKFIMEGCIVAATSLLIQT
jgi:hypothetical protein